MRKGENIFKRKDGRWEGRYIKGYELSGKAKYGFCYGKTYKEAKDKVSKCKAAIASGNPAQQSRSHRRFAFYCDEWLRFRKTKIKESTYVKYDAILEKHIKPKLGDCLPLGITTGLIDDFSKELLFESELSAKTVHDILVMLHSIIVHTAQQFPGLFPTVKINYPKRERKEMRVLSRNEQEQFVSFLLDETDQCKFGVLLMLLSGVRIGELCALKWENVDLENGTIIIDRQMQYQDGLIKLVSPKTRNSKRTVFLCPTLQEHLKKKFQQRAEDEKQFAELRKQKTGSLMIWTAGKSPLRIW